MEHVFTQIESKKINVIKKVEKSGLYAPNRQSLAFIMQFAAIYHVEKDLSLNSLSGFILN